MPQASLADSEIVACRNTECWRGQITEADRSSSQRYVYLQLQPDSTTSSTYLDVQLDTQATTDDFTFSVFWGVGTANTVMGGDMLTVTFSDSAGNTLLSKSGTITTFKDVYPNGKDCDPVPCHQATIDQTHS